MITIEKLKNNIGNWLVTFDGRNKLRTIQKIDEVIPQKYEGVIINGPVMEFFDLEIRISKNSHSHRHFSSELANDYNGIITEDELKDKIGKIIYDSINFKI